ncbi:MAG: hypothetical protein JOZ29_00925 [Deltaproteobacteria bacterium]|nr:hypothetical protein [Deltaproteobacteria bacterium]
MPPYPCKFIPLRDTRDTEVSDTASPERSKYILNEDMLDDMRSENRVRKVSDQ